MTEDTPAAFRHQAPDHVETGCPPWSRNRPQTSLRTAFSPIVRESR